MLNFTKYSTKHSISSSSKNTSILALLSIMLLLNVTMLAFHESFILTTTAFAETNTSLDSEKVQIKWLESHYPPNGVGIVQVIDPDMNLDSETVDYFDVDVWSDSDQAGIDLTVTETGKSTGIFEGTVFFAEFHSTDTTVRVAKGDVVTARYESNKQASLLSDTYTTAVDELYVTANTYMGYSSYDPCNDPGNYNEHLCRYPTIKTVDAFGNTLDFVNAGQHVQINADLWNSNYEGQSFVYFVQIQDSDDVVVSLEWTDSSLFADQSFGQTLPWIPSEAGSYTATAFVWESLDDPVPLFQTVSTTITVIAG